MKVLKFLSMALLAIVMSVGFIACSSDDDNDGGSNNTSLVGKWKSAWIGENADEKTFDLNNTDVDEVYSYYTFNSDGTGYELCTMVLADMKSSGKYWMVCFMCIMTLEVRRVSKF